MILLANLNFGHVSQKGSEEMKQITANVYTEDEFSVPPGYRGSNPSFVTTSEGIVMIDTPMLPTDAVKWRDDIAKRGEVRFIINTHHHIDHTTGNYFFPGIVVSHQVVKEMLAAPLSKIVASPESKKAAEASLGPVGFIRLMLKKLDPEGLHLLDEPYQVRPPTITFTEQLSLYVGGYTFECIHLSGHTLGHIGVYIPQEKVFFAGDNFTNASQPSLVQSLPLKWVESLKRIEAMDIDVVVPGHGKVCGKSEVREFRLFIQKCIGMVRKAIRQGMSKEEAADSISFEEFYPPVHHGSEMQRMNVSRLYEMLSEPGKGT